MTISPPTPLAESVARFDQAAAYLLDALADVAARDLDRPTPCAEWDVRAIVLHVTDVADALVDMVGTGTFDLGSTSRADGEVVAAAQDRVHRLVATLDAALDRDRLDAEADADRTAWAIAAAQGGAIDLTAHGWDLATACGSARPIPVGLAAELVELTASLIDEGSRDPLFAAPVPVGPSASAGDRFVAFLGRDPD